MLDDETYRQQVHRMIEDARRFSNDELSAGREAALRYMQADSDVGAAPEGRSQVVSTKMRDATFKMTEKLMEIFGSGDPVVMFAGVGDDKGKLAKQQTEYFQYELMTRNDGWRLQHDTFRSGLESSLSGIKVVWDERIEVWEEELTDVSDEELFRITLDEEQEILEQESTEEQIMLPIPVPNGMTIQIPGPVEVKHSLKVRHKGKKNRILIEEMAPEEIIYDRRATKPETARVLGHDMLRHRSDLRELGIPDDFIDAHGGGRASGRSADYQDRERSTRVGYVIDKHEQDDSSGELFKLVEAWVRIDRDEDGIAEWRHVIAIGDDTHVWLDEMARWPQIVLCTPYLRPHAVKGDSLLDLIKDLVDSDTSIWRSMLDNLNLTNNSRLVGLRGRFNAASFLNNAPGAIGIEYTPGAVRALDTPYTAAASLPVRQELERALFMRLGINPSGLGLDPDALQSQSEFSQREQWSQGQGGILMVARSIAETTMKPLARLVTKLYAHHQRESETLELSGEVIDVSPQEFDTGMDLKVRVGLGMGTKEQVQGALLWLLSKQEAAIASDGEDNTLTTAQMYRDALADFLKTQGIQDSSKYLKNPVEPDPNEQDPAAQAAAMEQQTKLQEAQIDQQTDLQKAQIDAQAKIQVALIQAQFDTAAKQAELGQEAALEQFKGQLQSALRIEEMNRETMLKIREQNIEAALDVELKQQELSRPN
ncbi:MAG: portal protein [Geminicoccaceae bacterium]